MLLLAQTVAVDYPGTSYPGIDGFLGTRASIMLDVVFLAMFLVVPMMALGIATARFKKRFHLHRQIQLTLGIVLLLAVVAFEVARSAVDKFGGDSLIEFKDNYERFIETARILPLDPPETVIA